MRTVLIVNPYASRVTDELVAEVARVLDPVRTLRTERPGHAIELARDADAESVFVFSGDGGFNEVLNGIRAGVTVGFVPGGGTSVLPRALGLPRDPVAAARRIAVGRTRRISLGRVSWDGTAGRRFAFSAGIGLDAELIRQMDARGRDENGRRPGDFVFAWTTLTALARHRGRFEPRLEITGHGTAAFALVGNGDPYTYAGPLPLRLTPKATFEGGLDVVAPRDVKARTWPRFAAYALRGRGQERAGDVFHGHDLDRIEIRCRGPQPLQVDGEDLGDVTEVVLEAERDAVAVLV
ncbi:MAG: diacylglycerol/lipid kinase family protein [Gaiellaceae bacterium]